MGELSNIEQFFSDFSLMLAINSIVANALLFSSLLLVIGVPVFYMTQANPEDNRNPNIKKIEILAGCLLYTSPSPRDPKTSRMPSSA